MNIKKLTAFVLVSTILASASACAKDNKSKINISIEREFEYDVKNAVTSEKNYNIKNLHSKEYNNIDDRELKEIIESLKEDEDIKNIILAFALNGTEEDKKYIINHINEDNNLTNCLITFVSRRCRNNQNYNYFNEQDEFNINDYVVLDNTYNIMKNIPDNLNLFEKTREFNGKKSNCNIYQMNNTGFCDFDDNIFIITFENNILSFKIDVYGDLVGDINKYKNNNMVLESLVSYINKFDLSNEIKDKNIIMTDEFIDLLIKMSKYQNNIKENNKSSIDDLAIIDTTKKEDYPRLKDAESYYLMKKVGPYIFDNNITIYEDINNRSGFSYVVNNDLSNFTYIDFSKKVYCDDCNPTHWDAFYTDNGDGVLMIPLKSIVEYKSNLNDMEINEFYKNNVLILKK